MFTLILVVSCFHKAVAITTIDGFGSAKTAEEAGKKAAEEIKEQGLHVKYSCIEKK